MEYVKELENVMSEDGNYLYVKKVRFTRESDRQCTFILGHPTPWPDYAENMETRKVIELANKMEFGKLSICYLFAMPHQGDGQAFISDGLIGPKCNGWILNQAEQSELVVCAWGHTGMAKGRGERVTDLLHIYDITLSCFGVDQNDQPIEPMLIRPDRGIRVY